MPGISKIIKNRIKSVHSAHNITKAMELVAAAKIKKAVSNLMASRVYAKHAKELLTELSKEKNLKHALLSNPKIKKELLIIVASNRGLCGSYNINVVKTAVEYLKNNKDKEVDLIVVGKKAESIFKQAQGNVIASFVNFPDDIDSDDVAPLSKMVIDEFSKKNYSKVSIAYTDFVSSLKYEPKVSSILPITDESLSELLESRNGGGFKKTEAIILFEPEEDRVLNLVLPRLTEVRIYQSLLESMASEHSARMMAMKSATDNAESMIEELTLYYNQARQSAITQEIAEISGGTEALTNG
jgi:F-type H+-transporting ATPase subunit gamma